MHQINEIQPSLEARGGEEAACGLCSASEGCFVSPSSCPGSGPGAGQLLRLVCLGSGLRGPQLLRDPSAVGRGTGWWLIPGKGLVGAGAGRSAGSAEPAAALPWSRGASCSPPARLLSGGWQVPACSRCYLSVCLSSW